MDYASTGIETIKVSTLEETKASRNIRPMLKTKVQTNIRRAVEKTRNLKKGINPFEEYVIFCDVCDHGFTRESDMEKHKRLKHISLNSFDENKEVNKVGTEFIKDNNKPLQSMINEKHWSYESSDENRESLTIIKEDTNNDSNGEFEDKNSRESGVLEKPARVRRKRDEIEPKFFCDICCRAYTRKYDMQKHRKSKHMRPEQNENPTEDNKRSDNIELLKKCKMIKDDKTSYYKCNICDKVFNQTYNLMRHYTIHTGERAFFCHICGKDFRISTGLRRHIKEHHDAVKRYSCDICDKTFVAKATYNEHLNIHTNTRPYVCDVCGKTFKQKSSLYVHKIFHTNNYRFECKVCGKKYRRSQELKVHSWIHTGHKPYPCHVCGARFRLRQDMRRHIKVHSKSSEFMCVECGIMYGKEGCLKNHMKKIHCGDDQKYDASVS